MIELKFLADVNVERGVVDYLRKLRYDVKWIPDFTGQMTDEDLLALANKERRIFITNDKDFGELVFLQKRVTAGVILFRVKGQRSRDKIRLVQKLMMGYTERLFNHYIVLTKNKIRIVPIRGKE